MLQSITNPARLQLINKLAVVQVMCEELDRAYRLPSTQEKRALARGLLRSLGEKTKSVLELGMIVDRMFAGKGAGK